MITTNEVIGNLGRKRETLVLNALRVRKKSHSEFLIHHEKVRDSLENPKAWGAPPKKKRVQMIRVVALTDAACMDDGTSVVRRSGQMRILIRSANRISI